MLIPSHSDDTAQFIRGQSGSSFSALLTHSTADYPHFSLNGPAISYQFHIDEEGELIHDHFGAPASPVLPFGSGKSSQPGWGVRQLGRRKEFPDSGRGDFRLPAIHICHAAGHTVTALKYVRYEIIDGKTECGVLPTTKGNAGDVASLVIHLADDASGLEACLRYSIFPESNAIARSFSITNCGSSTVTVERAASFSIDMPKGERDMIQLSGDWGSEAQQIRRRVYQGTQG